MAHNSRYHILSICSGVGGLDLALQISVENARTICHVEREAQAAAVLAARMEDKTIHEAPVWSDLSTFDGKPWRGLVDCIISGDPCQPNSVAGSRRGADDDRFLIDQLIRVIDEVRPSRMFRENVTGNADGQLAALVPALEEMGYSVAAGIFSAAEVGASHRRERLFIMANTSGRRRAESSKGKDKQQGRTEIIRRSEKVADSKSGKRRMGKSKERLKETDIAGRERELADAKGIFDRGVSKRNGKKHARPSVPRGNLADAISSRQRRESDQEQPPEQPNQSFRRLPYFAPGPNDPRWAEIIRQAPWLKPAVCRIFNGMAPKLDEVINEAEHHTQESWESYFSEWKELSRVRLKQIVTSPSRRLQQAVGGDNSLRDLSQSPSSSVTEFEMQDMRYQLQAQKVETLYNMWQERMFYRAWENLSEKKMGWAGFVSELRLLQKGLSKDAPTADDLRTVMWEQISLGKKTMRTDRLRAAGNGVCPMAGAIAWLSLSAHFE